MEWKDKYNRNTRPSYNELLEFLPDDVRPLFITFNKAMEDSYRVYNKYQRYEKTSGWVYGYCRNYRCELLSVAIGSGYFRVLGVKVSDELSLNDALEKAKKAYDQGYEEKYTQVTEVRRANQVTRTKARLEREKKERTELTENIAPEMLNKFNWCKKVSRSKLIRLYNSDARGLPDEDLIDDIGYTFYTRCKEARDIRECLEKGKLICHHCGAVLSPGSYTSPVKCDCGHWYTYREYRRSFNSNNLPAGRATPIFNAFADKWILCKDAKEKMILIDQLIHECHVSVMSGLAGRSVCVNLIEGTLTQLKDMLEMLAGH